MLNLNQDLAITVSLEEDMVGLKHQDMEKVTVDLEVKISILKEETTHKLNKNTHSTE